MKKTLAGLALILSVSFTAVHAQTAATAAAKAPVASASANMVFAEKENTHDFGVITQGKPITYNFTFKNTGKTPLILSSATGSCGCTNPEWPKEPILPGASSVIKVTYDAAAAGVFTKTVTITSNAASPTTVLYIKGEVKVAAAVSPVPAQPAGGVKKN